MIQAIKAPLKQWYSGYTSIGKFWLTLGIAALIVDAAISYQYGVTLTRLHGFGFALVAIFFALLPDAAYSEIEHRRIGSGVAMAALCIPLGMVAFYSHLGYGAGVRLGDMQQTGVHNAKFEDTRESLQSDKTNIELWRKQLADLLDQNAWAASVKADALRSQVATWDKAIENETKRGGCKSKCEAKMRERDALNERIGKIEQVEDLNRRIEATQRIIDGKTKEASVATYESSPVVNQNNVAAQLFLAFTGAAPESAINPDNVTASFTNIVIAGGGSLAFMIMAPVGFFLAGRFRRREEDIAAERNSFIAQRVMATAPVKADKPNGSTTINVQDLADDVRQALKEMAQGARGSLAHG